MTKRHNVAFNAKVTPVKPLNDELTLCKCYVMALGKNRNLSFIGKEAADAALPTLFNIPVIGHLYVDENGKYHMGGHDMTIVQDDDGEFKFQSLCVPYGVVPKQDDVHYEDVQEPNGDTHTYLVADVILWTGRFPELKEAIYSENTYFGQSMEINVCDYSKLDEDKNYEEILGYSYSALCLLGKSDNPDFHVEPCFPMARVDTYDLSAEGEKFVELMAQLKKELAFCFEDGKQKGGENMENGMTITPAPESITGIATDSSVTIKDTGLTFANSASISVVLDQNSTTSDLVLKVPKVENTAYALGDTEVSSDSICVQAEEKDTSPVKQESSFSFTYKEKCEAINRALSDMCEKDDNGIARNIYFYVCDFDDDYAYVERCEYKSEIDYNEKKGRFAYSFNETDKKTAVIRGEFEELFVKWLTKEELERLEAMQAEYKELMEYKARREREDFEAAIDLALTEFGDLEGNDEFTAIVEKKYTYETVEALRNACYIVRGKSVAPAKQHKFAATEPVVPVGTKVDPPSIYDEFFAKYGNKK